MTSLRRTVMAVLGSGLIIGMALIASAQTAIDPQSLIGEWNGSWTDKRHSGNNGQYS